VLDEAFLVTYGDSFLPIDFGGVFRAFRASGKPALMTVFANHGRWDTSNVIFEGGTVILYDKHRRTRPPEEFSHIDYGLLGLERRLVDQEVPRQGKSDLADLLSTLSRRGDLAGLEMRERFYEIGSPEGLEDFTRWITAAR